MPNIDAGTFSTSFTFTAADIYTLLANTTRTQTSAVGITGTVTAGPATIDILGTLVGAPATRAINASFAMGGEIRVGAGGIVQSANADAIRLQSAAAKVDLTNLGQIISGAAAFTPIVGGPNPGGGFAVTYAAVTGAAGAPATDYTSGGVITNGAVGNTTALIQSNTREAIQMGSHMTLVNYGTIKADGPVNDSSANNVFNGANGNPNTSVTETYDSSRGVRFNQNSGTAGKVENYGTIEGSQHAVDVGQTNITNLFINNYAGATILGHNGSGVGADTTGAAANTVTVDNAGTIRGEYAPRYDRAGYATIDGDADGVDVDGAATVINRAGGIIAGSGANGVLTGTGAGGFDSNGRTNRSEGISIGGGIITNDGTISGADFAITVNNDSNANNSRSGVLATTITNNLTGSIVGQNGFAIRLENKTGTASIDDDVIANAGTITGNGSIPDPAGVVLRQDNSADTGVSGTLDGVVYTSGTDAGNARFISGDGSAIQTGEGADTLTNSGSIIGNTGRAINLEGGSDTLNLVAGQTITGRIDGGAGSDTINLQGTGTGTLSSIINFENLTVQGGTWTLSDAQSYTTVSIAAGTLLVNESIATAATSVAGTFGGTGTVGSVSFASGGTLSAGNAGIGTLHTGALTFVSGANFIEEIGGTAPGTGYDQTIVSGAVDLGGATLDLRLVNGFIPSAGQSYTIISNDAADAVSGIFANLAEGASVTLGGVALSISYRGGDGNDVTLSSPSLDGGGGGGAATPSTGADQLVAVAGDNTIAGLAGNDSISGGDGNDLLFGNQGDDNIVTGAGANTVYGGMGSDNVTAGTGSDVLFGNEGADTINAGDGDNTIVGGQDSTDGADHVTAGVGSDVLLGNGGDDSISAGAGGDSVVGGFGNDILFGNQGNDLVLGNEGSDLIFGGLGDDTIYGGQGADTISGNEGNDVMFGSEGADRLIFGSNSGIDIINGFASNEGDRLDLMGQTYVLTQDAQGSATLNLSGGGIVTLAGIAASQVGVGFFA